VSERRYTEGTISYLVLGFTNQVQIDLQQADSTSSASYRSAGEMAEGRKCRAVIEAMAKRRKLLELAEELDPIAGLVDGAIHPAGGTS
jgi:hypothetical protein